MTISTTGVDVFVPPEDGNQHQVDPASYQQQALAPALVTHGLHGHGRWQEFAVVRWQEGIYAIATKFLGGSTKVGGTSVRRVVRVYRRSDGAFVKETTSRPDGLFDFSQMVEGEEYVLTCLDDVAPEDFNDLVHAQVTPVDNVTTDPQWEKDGGA